MQITNQRLIYLLACAIILSTPLRANSNSNLYPKTGIEDLAQLVNHRLSYMKDVAAYKWVNQLPIEDLEREAIVIRSSMNKAKAYGLDTLSTQLFFEQQINAAKVIQNYWFDHWRTKGFDTNFKFRDLTSEVRPALIDLGNDILTKIRDLQLWEQSKHRCSKFRSTFLKGLTTEGLPVKEKQKLFRAILKIRGSLQEEPIYQSGRLDSLANGHFDGDTNYGVIKHFGNFGLGTFNKLDGEMIAVDGQFYQVKTDGKAYPVPSRQRSPFSAVTTFDNDQMISIQQPMNLQELFDLISQKVDNPDGYYAIRVDGTFDQVKTRSVHAQEQPYSTLAEVIAEQVTFDFENIQGTMVGFLLPEAVAGQNATGFHFHFLNKDRTAGGHLLNGKLKSGTIYIDYCTGIEAIKKGAEIMGSEITRPETGEIISESRFL